MSRRTRGFRSDFDEDSEEWTRGREPVSISKKAVCFHDTRDAICVILDPKDDPDDEALWVPRSVIDESSSVKSKADDEGELLVQRWWAESKDLNYDD
jgi:hypothetical protein